MTLKQLEYFLEIAKMGSVTKAAQNLNISQPPLSLQLRALEEELGAPLFLRDKRGLEITSEGAMLRERAEAILALLDETARDIHAVSKTRQITIRIGTIGSVNHRLLPDAIARFRQDYPYVSFRVLEGPTDVVLSDLAAGKVDLGFVREPFNTAGLRTIPIRNPALKSGEQDCFATIALPQFYDHAFDTALMPTIDLDELQGKPLVIHHRYREMLVNACRKRGFNPYIICENGEIYSSLSWAQAGIGVAIAPYTSVILNKDPGLIIRRLDSMAFSPRVCLVWGVATKLGAEALSFINLLSD